MNWVSWLKTYMMFLHMNRDSIKNISVAVLLVVYSFIANAHAEENTGPASTLAPSANYDAYAEYLEQDKTLNSAYKRLSRLIDKSDVATLRLSQRKWIKWRDSTCLAEQAKINRQLNAFGTSVRDDCLMALTERRNAELLDFIESPRDASKKKFNFSRKNEYQEN